MDKDTLIYIVLGIVWAIISGVGKKKQKKNAPGKTQNRPPQSKPNNEELSLEDMISALRGEQPKSRIQKAPEPEPVYESNVDLDEHIVEEYTFKATKHVKPTGTTSKKKETGIEAILKGDHRALGEEDYDDGITFSFAEDVLEEKSSIKFNAREAMIYDVIMNRPKY